MTSVTVTDEIFLLWQDRLTTRRRFFASAMTWERNKTMIEQGLYLGDCLKLMQEIPDKSCNMILCDPPYGATRNAWDKAIGLPEMWAQFERIITDTGAIVLFSQQPFSSKVVQSNPAHFRYEWIWVKDNSTGFLGCKHAPLKIHENILVFSKAPAAYIRGKVKPMEYHPQMSGGKPYSFHRVNAGRASANYDTGQLSNVSTKSDGGRYPVDVLYFKTVWHGKHPTEKPVSLLRYLIRTYTEEGDMILDPTAGSGSTCVAAIQEGRRWLGIEKDAGYYDMARKRIEAEKADKVLF